MGFTGTYYLPSDKGGSITGGFSPIERGFILLGHELMHRKGIEMGNNNVAHTRSNFNGFKNCVAAGYCGSSKQQLGL